MASELMKDHASWILAALGAFATAISWLARHALGIRSAVRDLEETARRNAERIAEQDKRIDSVRNSVTEERQRREATECMLFEKLDKIANDVNQTRVDVAYMRNGKGRE